MVLQSLIIAISMYSAIPMPQIEWREDNMRWSLGCLPAVGLLAGGLLYGWSVLGAVTGMQPVLFGAVAVLLPIVLSGGFHMDGFLDAADGIFSRRDRQKRLEIMKDPHCGPFAVLCCGGLLLLELGAWCQLASVPKLLPLACCLFTVSRSLTVMAGSRLPYTSTSTLGVLFANRAARGVAGLGIAETAVSVAGLFIVGWLSAGAGGCIAAAVLATAAGLLFWWYASMVRREFGGITGDLLGFFVELSQGGLLLVLALCSLFLRAL